MKVGLIIDDYIVTKRIKDLIDLSLSSNTYEIDYLIIQKTYRDYYKSIFTTIYEYIKRRGARKFIEVALFKTILLVEKFFIIRLTQYRNFYSKYDLKNIGIKTIVAADTNIFIRIISGGY
jgi:hypothetical protein